MNENENDNIESENFPEKINDKRNLIKKLNSARIKHNFYDALFVLIAILYSIFDINITYDNNFGFNLKQRDINSRIDIYSNGFDNSIFYPFIVIICSIIFRINQSEIYSDNKNKANELKKEINIVEINKSKIMENNDAEKAKNERLFYRMSIAILSIIVAAFISFNIWPTNLPRKTNMYQDSNESEKTKKESSTQNYGSPESQFTQFQVDRMGPNYEILKVIMNLHKVDGNRIVYKGFYTFQIRGTTYKNKSFFFANFENGRFTGWLPDK